MPGFAWSDDSIVPDLLGIVTVVGMFPISDIIKACMVLFCFSLKNSPAFWTRKGEQKKGAAYFVQSLFDIQTTRATIAAAVSPGPKAMLSTGVPFFTSGSRSMRSQMCGTVAELMLPPSRSASLLSTICSFVS